VVYNPLDDIKRILVVHRRAVEVGFDLAPDLLSGDISQADIEQMVELWGDMASVTDEVSRLTTLGVGAAVIIAYGQFVAAVASGSIVIPGYITAVKFANDLRDKLQPVTDRIDKIQATANHVLDNDAVQASLQAAQTLHRLGLIVSPAYKHLIAELYQHTIDISRQVFNDSTTVASALGLIELATYDATRAAGNPVRLAETRYFGEAIRLSERVQRESRVYERQPGKFWADVTQDFIHPLQEETSAAASEERQKVNAATLAIGFIRSEAERTDVRFRTYTNKLAPFLSDKNIAELDDIRRNFHTDVTLPLEGLDTFLVTTFPPLAEETKELEKDVINAVDRIKLVEELTADPADLDEAEVVAQRLRESEISDSALEYQPIIPPEIRRVRSRLESILVKIRAE